MGLDLTSQAEAEIWAAAEPCCLPVTSTARLETVHTVLSVLGHSNQREIELTPGFNLCIFAPNQLHSGGSSAVATVIRDTSRLRLSASLA